jgi:hypothetical protein
MPRLCKKCGTYPRQLVADKGKKSSQSGEFTFSFPYYEEDFCYMCAKVAERKFNLPDEFFRRGNLVNHANDGNYPMKGVQNGLH